MFDDVFHLDERLIAEGKEAGREDGKARGFKEGQGLGKGKGFRVGAELGFYRGCCIAWLALHEEHPGLFPSFSDKALSSMRALVDLAERIPHENTRDSTSLQDIQRVRAKFRAVTAMVGFPIVFDPEGQVNLKVGVQV
ncbi:unnamed protein product [Discosporangium mesarthrocarpum]